MIFSYNWLQEYVKDKLPKPKKLADLLSKHSFEVEEVKKKNSDFVLDIDVRPNRAGDCFSHLGIARECSAIIGSNFKIPEIKFKEDKKNKTKELINVKVQEKECLRYTAKVITGVKVKASPQWLQKKLKVCGLKPINNIVDIMNYVMLETGQPMHAFDLDKIEGKEIIVRFAQKGEKMFSLDNNELKLNENILVIADQKKSVAVAGIKGGKGPGVDQNTSRIVLEAANFDSKKIRQASRLLKLRTDASYRFEHGLDLNLTEKAIQRASQLVEEIAQGKTSLGVIDYYPEKSLPKIINFDANKIKRLLNIDVPKKEIKRILKTLGFKILEEKKANMKIEVPTFRIDVTIQADLIEEIGRIYGYDQIPTISPQGTLLTPIKNLNIFWENFVKDRLKESGFTEVYNYSFISKEDFDTFNFDYKKIFELENPLSENYQYLSPSFIPNLLKNVKDNFRYYDYFKIFELGKVFQKFEKIKEKRCLTGLIAHKGKEESFYRIKGAVSSLLRGMGLSDFYYDNYEIKLNSWNETIWDSNKLAEIKTGEESIGLIGSVSSNLLKSLDIKGKIILFDLDFETLQKLATEEHEYNPISSYPSAVRDLSIIVPQKVNTAEILNIIHRTGKELIRDVDLFDIYQGENLPEGEKSLAFHIVYQSKKETLSSQEIKKLHEKIIKNLEKNINWKVRK